MTSNAWPPHHNTAAARAAVPQRADQPEAAIVPMRSEHLAGAVRLHQLLFPNEMLAQLGPRAMLALYRTYLESPRCIAFAAVCNEALVGVVSGALGPGFIKEVIRRHPWVIASAAAVRLLRAPGAVRAIATFPRRGTDPWPGDPAQRFYWRMIMIDPEWRGHGVVVPLVRALLREARQRGAREACSATYDHNLPMVWVQKVFKFESRVAGPGPRYYRLDLDRLS